MFLIYEHARRAADLTMEDDEYSVHLNELHYLLSSLVLQGTKTTEEILGDVSKKDRKVLKAGRKLLKRVERELGELVNSPQTSFKVPGDIAGAEASYWEEIKKFVKEEDEVMALDIWQRVWLVSMLLKIGNELLNNYKVSTTGEKMWS